MNRPYHLSFWAAIFFLLCIFTSATSGSGGKREKSGNRPEEYRLTEDEKAWLKAHPVIRLAPDPEFQPIEFFDENGKWNGYAKGPTEEKMLVACQKAADGWKKSYDGATPEQVNGQFRNTVEMLRDFLEIKYGKKDSEGKIPLLQAKNQLPIKHNGGYRK